MPRMSEAEKRKSHARILDAAAGMLRARGIEATSVGDVMKAAGMTHGGFYRHFASKEALLAAGIDHAADTVLGGAEQEAARDGERAAESYIATYLSDAHRRDRKGGCPLAAIGGEALRGDDAVRAAAERAARRAARLLSSRTGARDADDPNDAQGLAILTTLVGTIVLARLFQDDDEAARVIEAGRRAVETLRKRVPEGSEEEPGRRSGRG